ncbi:MAG: hypoxanthine phosphoribosyltransferase, partial [Deferribacterales bacterium]
EDIIDTGLTINYLKRLLMVRNPNSLKVCALLDKPSRRLADINPDYCGFTIPDEFVVGYGLDYNGYYRNLKDICKLTINN